MISLCCSSQPLSYYCIRPVQQSSTVFAPECGNADKEPSMKLPSSALSTHLEDDVPFVQVAILGGQTGAGHLFDEDLTPQPEAIL